jgi:hypothetical protein
MVEQTDDVSNLEADPGEEVGSIEETLAEAERPITLRVILSSFLGGLAGLVAMVPVLVGLPILLGVFQLDAPIGFARLVGAEPSATLGLFFFAAGAVVVLPLFFSVTGTFLPPVEPRYLRGVPMSVIFWPGFVIIFWPAGNFLTNSSFVVVSLLAHLVYGLVLGIVLHSLTGIPEHEI